MRPGMRFRLSAAEKRDVWRRWKAGQTLHEIGRVFDKPHSCIRSVLLPRGGIPPIARRRSRLALTLAEREDISRAIASGSSIRESARVLGRAASGLLLRSAKPLAAWHQRKHELVAAAILPARHRPVALLPSAARPGLAALESTSKKNFRLSNSGE
jgi:hypothetical protein